MAEVGTAPRNVAMCRWKKAEQNEAFQTYSNYGIGAAYGLIGLVAFVSTRVVGSANSEGSH